MVKIIRLICIAGILALLVLFVLFTGAGRTSTQKRNDNSFKHQTNKASKKENKNIEISTHNEVEALNRFIPW